MHKLRNFRHVTAVGGLVKNNVDPGKRSSDGVEITKIALDEFRLGI